MSNESELATVPVTPGFHRATSTLATTLGIEPRMMVDTLKKQCFPGQHADAISDAQLAAFISVANALKLNPLVPGMLYAYPSKNGGIVPVTGPDGVFKMLDEHITEDKLEGYECEVFPEDTTLKPTHAVATIWRKGREHPSKYTAIFSEWVVGSNPNWSSRPRHMIWVRALKQCARQVIHGIPFDEDEVVIGEMRNVTPPPDRAPPPSRSTKGAKAAKENAAKADVVIDAVPGDPAPAETTAPTPAPPPPAPDTPAPEPAPTQAAPRAFLKPDEELTVDIEIVSLRGVMLGPKDKPAEQKPSVIAKVQGGFEGEIRAEGHGSVVGDNIVPNATWVAGAKMTVTLFGRQMPNGVKAYVESVDTTKAGPEVVE